MISAHEHARTRTTLEQKTVTIFLYHKLREGNCECRDHQSASALAQLMEVAKAQLPQKRRQELTRVYKKEALHAQRRSHKRGMPAHCHAHLLAACLLLCLFSM